MIDKYLHHSQEIRSVIRNKCIMEMKGRYNDSSQSIISFGNKLFERTDFPQLESSMRHYANE
jgi:hypothetical protein